MSGIAPLDSTGEYAPNRYEEKREDVDLVKAEPREESQIQTVDVPTQQQDQKNTIQASQYTGKGSFIDKIF